MFTVTNDRVVIVRGVKICGAGRGKVDTSAFATVSLMGCCELRVEGVSLELRES